MRLSFRKLPLGKLWSISNCLLLVSTLAISPSPLHWLSVEPRSESSGLDARSVTASKLGISTKRLECNPATLHETALPRRTVVLITTSLPCMETKQLENGAAETELKGSRLVPAGHPSLTCPSYSLEALHECVSHDPPPDCHW